MVSSDCIDCRCSSPLSRLHAICKMLFESCALIAARSCSANCVDWRRSSLSQFVLAHSRRMAKFRQLRAAKFDFPLQSLIAYRLRDALLVNTTERFRYGRVGSDRHIVDCSFDSTRGGGDFCSESKETKPATPSPAITEP